MQATSQKASIREMSPDELKQRANELYAQCGGDVLSLAAQEHEDLCQCAANYYQMTGEILKVSAKPVNIY